jgi:hypothetical protein
MKLDDTARFFGPSEKLWPELFTPPGKAATMLCRDCREVAVSGIRRFCDAAPRNASGRPPVNHYAPNEVSM